MTQNSLKVPVNTILQGDVLEQLKKLPDESIDMICTSPPYYGLRDYGTATWEGGDGECDHKIPDYEKDPKYTQGTSHVHRFNKEKCYKCGAKRIDRQIGLEPTLDEYLNKMLSVTLELKRVLKKTGTMWWNHGDSYGGSWQDYGSRDGGQRTKSTESWNRGDSPSKERCEIPPSAYLPQKSLTLQNYRLAIMMMDDDSDDEYELRKDAPDWVKKELTKKGLL